MTAYIRPATPADSGGIWRIYQEVIAEGGAFMSTEQAARAETLARWFAAGTKTFVAEMDGEPGIVGAYKIMPNHWGRGAHVANATYMVAQAWRGRRIGRMLGEHSLEAAREAGYRAMQFNAVVSTNAPAVELWQSLGFTVIGTVPEGFRLPDGTYTDLLIMHRFL